MRTDELDFDLPADLIAQAPVPNRHASRLLHYRKQDGTVAHRMFSDLPALLRPDDLLVFNDARVLPARFMLRKITGGGVEGLFLEEVRPGEWRVLLRNAGTGAVGSELQFELAPELSARIIDQHGEGEFTLAISPPSPAAELLDRIGRMPLPPYIKREKGIDPRDEMDRTRYQTVFARVPGAVAAPTAALHFSDTLLTELDDRGIERSFVTLQVGLGTFKPVTAEKLEDHKMHVEAYSIGESAADTLNRAKSGGRRIIAVGTTAARVLESQPADRPFSPHDGRTGIFIQPGYQWRHVGGLVTNFHLPRSTLIALVASFTGLEEQRRLYRIAIEQGYRFFSYGDGMFLE